MNNNHLFLTIITAAFVLPAHAEEVSDSAKIKEVVVTGTRSVTDIRHLPMTVTIIDRDQLTEKHESSILPTVMEQVPGLFVTSRAMRGYGVSTGASGNISLRGLSGSSGQMLVLIDGHPQYNGIYSHPISDSYQTLMAERVEVLRGPASTLYGSSAMGGVINIVTRQMKEDGIKTDIDLSGGSYGTLEAEASNRIKSGRFSSTVSAQYARSDNHRSDMAFEQYSGYAKAAYELSSNWNTYIDANLTHFDSEYPGNHRTCIWSKAVDHERSRLRCPPKPLPSHLRSTQRLH